MFFVLWAPSIAWQAARLPIPWRIRPAAQTAPSVPRRAALRLDGRDTHRTWMQRYSFSHNHGCGNWPYLKGNCHYIGWIFHFHVCGRKGNALQIIRNIKALTCSTACIEGCNCFTISCQHVLRHQSQTSPSNNRFQKLQEHSRFSGIPCKTFSNTSPPHFFATCFEESLQYKLRHYS